ncbi:MAG: phage tail protein [Thermosynechococcaceae cyanobacterium]
MARPKLVSASKFEIQNGTGQTIPILSFENVGISTEESSHNVGNTQNGYSNNPTAGPRKPSNPTLKALATDSKDLYDWYDKAHPKTGAGSDVDGNLYACKLIGKDATDAVVFEVALEDVMPVKYEAPTADSSKGEVAKETLELVCSYADRTK